jgi:hypothetical protein
MAARALSPSQKGCRTPWPPAALCLQVAGPLQLRWCRRPDGSTQCSPHPAADARSAPHPARPGATPSTAAPAPHRQAAGRSLLHRGQGPEPPGPGAVAKSGPQATGATLRAPDTRRPDPHRRQEAGPLPRGGASHHRQPAAGPLH